MSFPDGKSQRDVLYEDMQLMLERPDLNLGDTIMVQKYGPIRSDEEARDIGESINADLVVWGYIPSNRANELHPSFTLLSEFDEPMLGTTAFNVQISGDYNTSILTNRVSTVTSYVLALLYLNSSQRVDFNTATKLLGVGIAEAKDEYDKSSGRKVDLGYNLGLLYVASGRAYAAFGDEEAALNEYNHALEYSPGLNGAYIGIGNIYFSRFYVSHQVNDLDTAYSSFEKALPSWNAYYGLGLVSYSRGDYEYAVDYFQKSLTGALGSGISENGTTVMKIRYMIGLSYKALGLLNLAHLSLNPVCKSEDIKPDLKFMACDELATSTPTVLASPTITHTSTLLTLTKIFPSITRSPVESTVLPATIPAIIMPPTNPPPTASPSNTPNPPGKECRDGFDNDGDGFIDMQDPQCRNPGDDSEGN